MEEFKSIKKNKYNPDIHHRRSIRLRGYDYSQEGLYFITLCTQGRAYLFGEIADGEMRLNEIGQIVENEWLKSAEIRKEIKIHQFIVMPNHFHGIIEIIYPDNDDTRRGEWHSPLLNTPLLNSPPLNTPLLQSPLPNDDINDWGVNDWGVNNQGECHSPLRSPAKTVGSLIRGFKSSVTKQLGFSPWQRNYYEHIIRNHTAYARIADYIADNPANWNTDSLYNPH